MNRIPVALFHNRLAAEPVQRRLVEAGVRAEIHSELRLEKFWFVKSGTGARLEVPSDQFERTEQLLLDWDTGSDSLREAVHCPECKSLRVEYPQFTRKFLIPNLMGGLLAETGLLEKGYYCEDCHCMWAHENAPPPRQRAHMAPRYFIE